VSAPEQALTITALPPRPMATMMAAKGITAEQIGEALGITLTDGPAISGGEDLAAWGTGPGQWLLVAPAWPGGSLAGLRQMLAGRASVVEQTGTYLAESWQGPGAEALLQRGLALDLSPGAFAPGGVRVSQIAHMGVTLARLAADRFEVLIFRSMRESFSHWTDTQSAGIALTRTPSPGLDR